MNSPAVQNSVAELIRIIRRTPDVSSQEVQKLSRLLRPTTSALSEHVPAMKHRLREEILRNANVTRTNGPASLAEFDRLVDELQHVSPTLVPGVLSVLEPLAFQKHLSKVTPSYISSSGGGADQTMTSDAAVPSASEPRRFIPIVQPHLAGDEAVQAFRSEVLWMSPDTEEKLLKDLLYVFQVSCSTSINF